MGHELEDVTDLTETKIESFKAQRRSRITASTLPLSSAVKRSAFPDRQEHNVARIMEAVLFQHERKG
jgi:hypothetical protein